MKNFFTCERFFLDILISIFFRIFTIRMRYIKNQAYLKFFGWRTSWDTVAFSLTFRNYSLEYLYSQSQHAYVHVNTRNIRMEILKALYTILCSKVKIT